MLRMLPSEVSARAGGSLADFTQPALIVPELRERGPAGVIKELSQVLHQQGCVPDLLAFYHAALNHEFLVNSAAGSGLAFPHARLNGVVRSTFAFGRSPEPFSWVNRPSAPVQYVFLLAVPATDAAGFLQLLSALAKLGQDESALMGLAAQQSAEEVYQFFQEFKVRGG
jgi:fructose PTS system EIIA component